MRNVILHVSDDRNTEVEWVLSTILGFITFNGYKESDFAIVCCDEQNRMTYRRTFVKRGIAIQDSNETLFPDQPIIQEALKVIRILRDPYDEDAFRRMMGYFGRIEPERVEMILWAARMKGVTPSEGLREYIDSLPASSLRSEGRMLVRVLENKHTSIASVMLLLVNCNFYRKLRMVGDDDPEGMKRYYLDRLAKMAKQFDKKKQSPDLSVSERIRRFESYLWDQCERQQKESVYLTSIGEPLDRDYFIVFVMGAIDQTQFASHAGADFNRKSLNAALSRSKRTPYITFYRAKDMGGYYAPCRPSRLVDEIPDDRKRWMM